MGFAQSGDYIYDESEVLRTDLKYEYAPGWEFHWAASYREAYQNFDHFYSGTYCGLDGKTFEGKACTTPKGYVSQIYYWQETSNKTTSNTFDIKGEFNTGSIKHNLMLGTDWVYEQREPKLANTYANGSDKGQSINGYVDPITGERYNTRDPNKNLKINQHNYNEGTNLHFFFKI